MQCQAHADVTASRSCHSCLRPMCKECSQEVLGSFYCEECLERRLGDERQPRRASSTLKLPALAAAFSFCVPGLGQVYNGLMSRALAQFVTVLLLFWLGGIVAHSGGGGLVPLLVLGALVYWVWQAADAWGTARDINRLGRVPDPEEARALGRGPLPGMDRGSRPLGIVMIAFGALMLLNNVGLSRVIGRVIEQGWPVAMVLGGVWLLRRGQREREAARRADQLDLEMAPGSEGDA